VQPSTRRVLEVLLRVVGLVLLVGLFAWRVDWAAVGVVLDEDLRGGPLVVALLAYAAGQVLNGLGWRRLVGQAGIAVGFAEMIRHDLGSVFWSVVLPGSVAGEVVKGARVAGGLERAESTASAIVSARLAGAAAAGLLALAFVPATRFGPTVRAGAAAGFAAVVAVALVGLLLVRLGPAGLRRLWPSLADRLPPGATPRLSGLVFAATMSLLAHLCFTLVFQRCFAAVGAAMPLPDAAVVYVLTTVALALPITFGGLGVRELSISSVGGLVVAPPAAAAAAMVATVVFMVPVAVGGLSEAARMGGRRRR